MFWYQKLLERMKTIKNIKGLQALREERGAIFVLTALLLPVLFGFLGIGYDVGNLYMHKAHLQNIADAAALAGARGYVNSLKGSNKVNATDKKVYLAQAGDDLAASKAVHDTAKAKLKTDANQYIEKNNPWYSIGEGNADYKYGKTGGTNSVEYFRVSLTERARVYFLPVIGIDGITDVVASTAVKLTDVERIGVPTGENTPTEAEHKPVVIAGNMFFDETNWNSIPAPFASENYEGQTLARNSYNASNVYIAKGGKTGGQDGRSGKIWSTMTYSELNGEEIETRISNVSELQESDAQYIDYDMDAFGEQIRELFRKKQEDYAKVHEIYIKTLPQEMQDYITSYKNWQASNPYANNRYAELVAIYQKLDEYKNLSKDKAREKWENDGHPLNSDFETIWSKANNWRPYPSQPEDWTWSHYDGWVMFPAPVYNGSGTLPSDALTDFSLDEYYMTYRGTKENIHTTNSHMSTKKISTDPSQFDSHLPSNEHSYFYLSKATLANGYTVGDLNFWLDVDGFYVGEDTYNVPYEDENGPYEDENGKKWNVRQVTRKYDENTPFYFFIEEDSNFNIHLEFTADCNRPLIFCYLGPASVQSSGNANNRKIRGILYMPNNDPESHANWAHVTFSGSVVAKNWTLKGKYNDFRYNPTEVNKWKESEYEYVDENGETKKVKSDGLPVTPNYGFSDSSSSGSSSAGGEVTTDKITLPVDHLRIVLPGETRDASHYKESEVTWENL